MANETGGVGLELGSLEPTGLRMVGVVTRPAGIVWTTPPHDVL